MRTIGLLKNTIQEYAWGSHTAISELLGDGERSERPQAELWMGAHPKASSLVKCGEQWIPLLELIERQPEAILGEKVADTYHNKLPYLLKILAAAKPLSIQAHPNLEQARAGFQRENALDVPLDAPNRNYRDPNHKPECLCALTPFWALNGFRAVTDILSYLEQIWPDGSESEWAVLRTGKDSLGLERFFGDLMGLEDERKLRTIKAVIPRAHRLSGKDPVFGWMVALHNMYPVDIGILSPVLFNLICLEPGQAMYLPAGEPHAYLCGVGIELMANSDNVLRGGLTPKHIDVPELMRVLNFKSGSKDILLPVPESDCEYRYPGGADEFALSVLLVKDGRTYDSPVNRSVEILLCTKGRADIEDIGNRNTIQVKKGTSILIPACVKAYTISGNAEIYRAAVPI
jgi:mannose-6-phosphate isomerase